MKFIELEARRREGAGKGPARQLRSGGEVPAIIYGGEKPVSIRVPTREFEAILRHEEGTSLLIDIKLDEAAKPIRALLKELQRDPVRSGILHADFQQIRAGQTLQMTTPIHLIGTPTGVKEQGGVLDHMVRQLEVECTVDAVPDFVEVDVSELNIGDSIHLRDLTPPPDVVFRQPGEVVICAVVGRVAEEEPVAEEVEAAEAGEAEEGKGEAEAKDEGKEGESS
jgi:large subunit ribosomal protein L25